MPRASKAAGLILRLAFLRPYYKIAQQMAIFLFLLFFAFTSAQPELQPNMANVAKAIKVTHFDCNAMTQNKLYALNQVEQCKVAPENLEVSRASVTLYTKHFRKTINATMCRLKMHTEQWHCGSRDHSSMDMLHPGITSDLTILPADCKAMGEGKRVRFNNQELTFIKGKEQTFVLHGKFGKDQVWDGERDTTTRNECRVGGWIRRETFQANIQDVELNVKMKGGRVTTPFGLVLPCSLEDLGCESTSLDPYAYTWEAPDNCVLAVHRQETVNMIKQGSSYYMVSGDNATTRFLFEIFNRPQSNCLKPDDVYPTNYDSLYVSIHMGGFDMSSGRRLGTSDGETKHLQYYKPTDGSYEGRLHIYCGNKDPFPSTAHYLNMDYELRQGTKLDYLFFESTRLLEASEIQLLKAQCEQERTQILTVLMLSMENPRLAGYMLTGNRSMFLSTDGSLAWLYHCPEAHSPLHTMNQCYDKIPIFYKGSIQFVDPITRQTYPNANAQNCSDRIKNLFQMDMDDKDSWFTLTPNPVHRDRPAIFGPKNIQPLTSPSLGGSQNAGMYTQNQIFEFWDNILISAASRNALQKFSRELITPSMARNGPDSYSYYAPRTDFYVDNMISPDYFSSQFVKTFGSIAYILEKCGQWFAMFLFIKFVVDLSVLVLRYFEIQRMTGRTLGFTKTLLSASYHLFFTSVLTSIFTPRAPFEESIEHKITNTETNVDETEPQEIKKKGESLYPTIKIQSYAAPI